jgi:circadian clock protein KaiB
VIEAGDDLQPELTLFVSGASDLSARAIAAARDLCDVRLGGRFRLSVVDVHEDPAAVLRHGVRAAPTLVRTWPLPRLRFIGDLSQPDQVLLKLELAVADPGGANATDLAI